MKKINEIEKIIEYNFINKTLLKEALSHSSYANEHRNEHIKDNERLEFLGDAVLEVITSDYLFRNYTNMPEGELTKLRASIVCEKALAYCARNIQLGEFLLLGKGERLSGGANRDSIISDALEALIGAIYLDSNLEEARTFIQKTILDKMDNKQLFNDSKTKLQELIQIKDKKQVTYVLERTSGPDHNKTFEVSVLLGDQILGNGKGHSKKEAEQYAAWNAIEKLNKERE